jgi:tetratricopeptide (TPR) repeat protein
VSRTIRIFYIAFIALVVGASVTGGTALWGASSWRSVSLTAATVMGLGLLLLLAGRLRGGLEKLLEIPDRWSWKGALTISAILFVAMWLTRTGHFLWSDRFSMGIAIERGTALVPSAPLGTALSRGFFDIVNRLLFWNAFETSALLSVIAGLAFAWAVKGTVRSFSATAMIVAGGFFAVFFGLGGASPLAAVGAGVFIWLSAVRLRGGRIPLVLPVIVAGAAIALHLSNIFLAVPAIYLIGRAFARRDSRLEAAGAAGTLAVCWIAAELAATRLAGSPGMAQHMVSSSSRIIPSFAGASVTGALSNAFNALVLAGPAALLAVVLAAGRGKRKATADSGPDNSGPYAAESAENRSDPDGTIMTFLRVTAAAAAIFIFIASPRIRGGMRWELTAPAAAAMSVFAAAALGRLASSAGEFRSSAALLTALGIFHLIPMIMTGFSLEAGERRLLDLPLPQGKAETVIGAQAWYDRDFEKAAEWWKAASEKDGDNADIWNRLGSAMMRLEEPLDAITYYHRATEIEPDNHVYRTGLAEAYIEQRWFPEANAELEQLTAEFPDSARLWTRLGYARNHGNMYAGAVVAYEKALALDPENDLYRRNLTSAILNRGAELQKEGDLAGARKMYHYARAVYPQDWVSLNNLAALEMELEEWEKARDILVYALKEQVGVAQLHFNMSVVLENLGEYEEAVGHLREATRLDPFNPPAAEHVDRLMRKAREAAEKEGEADQ